MGLLKTIGTYLKHHAATYARCLPYLPWDVLLEVLADLRGLNEIIDEIDRAVKQFADLEDSL